jgi:hypothetical protein
MIPVYFLFTNEANAQENFERLCDKYENVIPVEGTNSIFLSHKRIADQCDYDRFYVVDADCWLVDNFKFQHNIELRSGSVAVFRAKNPINGLVYGHGGVKLFSKDCFSLARLERPDMTTSLADEYIKVNILASEHRFNYSPYSTWRTAFREAVKLSAGLNKNNNDQESKDRLAMWSTAGIENLYGYFSIQGAKQGIDFAHDPGNDPNKVNDFEYLRSRFVAWTGINDQ